ncbi:5'-nucleotidase surE [Gossypium arboreum]|uniref:5'-nucleotidase surE n=2 Tax=Gossypium arboreum TaxID=29729 RepID=A0A0B0PX96_GOSAR|nr:uncharacterized protein LOC128286872 [Gossypium arboreum]KAK5842972.1 hypothetical protein PVK06_005396 [Gossypium arboreum]KHG29462.1 5'-nucleotidase surE [Gossypium arboreum]
MVLRRLCRRREGTLRRTFRRRPRPRHEPSMPPLQPRASCQQVWVTTDDLSRWYEVTVKENEMVELKLDDGEEEVMLLPTEFDSHKSICEFCLVGCSLTASIVHFPKMRSTMASLRYPLGSVKISVLGERRYLFKFFHKMNIE